MQRKLVKIEIGKVLAIIIVLIIIAILAGIFVQGSYFQGNIRMEKFTRTYEQKEELIEEKPIENLIDPSVSFDELFIKEESDEGREAETVGTEGIHDPIEVE